MDKLKQFFKENYTEVLKPIIVLLCICIIIPFALAGTNLITRDRIAELEKNTATEQMQELFPKSDFKALKDDKGEYHIAQKEGELLGYIFNEKGKGYGGDVAVMVAINTDGTVKAIRVLDASGETPGLGQNIKKTNFYEQFEGLSKIRDDRDNSEIVPVSGATISSRAVKTAVGNALERFSKMDIKTAEEEVKADEK